MKNANDLYKNDKGTDHFHKHMLNFIITDGIKNVCNDLKCWWFLDVVVSYKNHPSIVGEGFQVWKLEREGKSDKFKVTATDGDDNILVTQEIPFSDFEHDELTFWCNEGIVFLPSEY